jgi:3-oxoacyl-[acyl-carrier protein] reductase
MLLEGKVALITGASRGIGAATARRFGREGAAVAVNYKENAASAEKVVDEIRAGGGRAVAIQADVTDPAQVREMVRKAVEALGPVDALVLNAGLRFKMAPVVELSWEDFAQKYVGELKAAFFCVKEVAPSMIERGSGSIVAVSSGLSHHPGDGFVSHSASKAALNAFVRALAHELGPRGVRVNTVSPGLTLTDATAWMPEEQQRAYAQWVPLRRNGLPEDIAGAIVFLASDLARFVTGGYVPVDGGTTMP